MIKTAALIYDAHWKGDEKTVSTEYKVARKFIKKVSPDQLIFGGDAMHCQSLSHWAKDKNQARKMEGQRWFKEIDYANTQLDFYKFVKEVHYLEGNHEAWVEQYIDQHPVLEGSIEIQVLLRLKERGIKWWPYIPDVDVKDRPEQILQLGKLFVIHGYYTGQNHAKKTLNRFFVDVIYGHTHQTQRCTLRTMGGGVITAYGVGCTSGAREEYLKGTIPDWNSSVTLVEYSTTTGNFQVHEHMIYGDELIYNGKVIKC